jgi:hypothetical protein
MGLLCIPAILVGLAGIPHLTVLAPGFSTFPAWVDSSSVFVKLPGEYHEGRDYSGGTARSSVPFNWSPAPNLRKEEEGYGAVRALDPQTGERTWDFKMTDVTEAGILTTASDLLFSAGGAMAISTLWMPAAARCYGRRPSVRQSFPVR